MSGIDHTRRLLNATRVITAIDLPGPDRARDHEIASLFAEFGRNIAYCDDVNDITITVKRETIAVGIMAGREQWRLSAIMHSRPDRVKCVHCEQPIYRCACQQIEREA